MNPTQPPSIPFSDYLERIRSALKMIDVKTSAFQSMKQEISSKTIEEAPLSSFDQALYSVVRLAEEISQKIAL